MAVDAQLGLSCCAVVHSNPHMPLVKVRAQLGLSCGGPTAAGGHPAPGRGRGAQVCGQGSQGQRHLREGNHLGHVAIIRFSLDELADRCMDLRKAVPHLGAPWPGLPRSPVCQPPASDRVPPTAAPQFSDALHSKPTRRTKPEREEAGKEEKKERKKDLSPARVSRAAEGPFPRLHPQWQRGSIRYS